MRADPGTAETPALPISGLILLPSLRKRFRSLTNNTPAQVAMINARAPSPKIFTEAVVRKVVPGVKPLPLIPVVCYNINHGASCCFS